MVSNTPASTTIPVIDFSSDMRALQPGSEGWNHLCKQVRHAGENYGCFVVRYDDLLGTSHQEMFSAMKPLFELPLEKKKLNFNPKPYYGYIGKHRAAPLFDALFESFGFEDAQIPEVARASTDLLWPEGNQEFCNNLNRLSKKMVELDHIIRRMILDSYGVAKYHDSLVAKSNYVLRVQQYDTPDPPGSEVALTAHTDRNFITILCQDEVGGLEVLSKQGEWISMPTLPGSFLVLIGDSFLVWTNNRLQSANHRVVMSGDKQRFSCGLFTMPKEGTMVEVPEELVDEEHPLLFKPFNFIDYIYYYHDLNAKLGQPTIHKYAGLQEIVG